VQEESGEAGHVECGVRAGYNALNIMTAVIPLYLGLGLASNKLALKFISSTLLRFLLGKVHLILKQTDHK